MEYADYLPVKLAFDSVKKNIHLKPAHKWIAVCSDEDEQCHNMESLERVARIHKYP